jgi:hypothetical protein
LKYREVVKNNRQFKRVNKGDIQVGTRVIYVSGNHHEGSNNPLWGGMYGHVVGTVDKLKRSGMPLTVTWDDGGHNSYNYRDLALAPIPEFLPEELFDI